MKKTLLLIILLLVVGTGAFVMSGNSEDSIGGNAISNSNFNGQAVTSTLKVVGSQYVLEPSSFKKGVPVKIQADMSQMPGCSKSIVISAFNVRKNLNANDNIIEFTPNKAGTFNIACSMNMYRGTFTVLESDGSKTNYVEPTSTKGGTCGGGCGGCGG